MQKLPVAPRGLRKKNLLCKRKFASRALRSAESGDAARTLRPTYGVESMEAKDRNHPLFEEARKDSTFPSRTLLPVLRMTQVADNIPVAPGIIEVGNKRDRGRHSL